MCVCVCVCGGGGGGATGFRFNWHKLWNVYRYTGYCAGVQVGPHCQQYLTRAMVLSRIFVWEEERGWSSRLINEKLRIYIYIIS